MARDLEIRITADNSDAQAKLAQTEQALGGLQTGAKDTSKEMSSAEDAIRKVGAAIGAAFSVQQLARQAGEITGFASRIADTAKKLGIGVEALQEIKFAFEQNGRSIDQAGNAIARMGINITQASDPFKAAVGDLGLSLERLQTMKPEDAFFALGQAINQVADPMQRSAAAAAVFGARLGPDLLPVFTNMDELRQKARDMGLVLKTELIDRGDALGDLWDAQKIKMNVARTEGLLPLFDLYQQLPGFIQTGLVWVNEFSGVLSGLGLAIMSAGGPVKAFGLFAGAVSSLGGLLSTAGGAIATFVAAIGAIPFAFAAAVAALVIYRKDILEDLGGLRHLPKLFADIGTSIKGFAVQIGTFFAGMATTAVGYAQQLYTGVKTWLVDKFTGIVGSVQGGIEKVKGFFKDLYVAVVGRSYIPDLVDEVGQNIQRLIPLMVEPVGVATARVSSLFREMTSGISNLFSGWGNSLGGWVQSVIPGIFGAGLGGIASGLLDGLGGMITGGISQLINLGVNAAWQGLQWLGGKIKGLFGNATKGSREDFASSLGFGSLSALYSHLQGLGPAGAQLAHIGLNVVGRNDRAANERWMQDVQRLIGGSGAGFSAAPAFGASGSNGLTGAAVSEGDTVQTAAAQIATAIMAQLQTRIVVENRNAVYLDGRQMAFSMAPYHGDVEAFYGV